MVRSMKRAICALVLAAAVPQSVEAGFVTGENLNEYCVERDEQYSNAISLGYVMGVVDGVLAVSEKAQPFCMPPNADVAQARGLVCDWLSRNPAQRQITGDATVIASLSEAWPCPKQ